MAETTFYSYSDGFGAVTITSSRVTIGGDVQFVRNIASAKVRYSDHIDKTKDLLRKLAIAGAIILGIVLAITAKSAGVGLFVAVAGIIAAFVLIKPKFRLYHLYLGLSSGEADAYRHSDENVVKKVRDAIMQAVATFSA